MKNKTKKGFTIVELVIVIAVIGILSAVLIPLFSGLVDKAYLSADESMVRNINNQLAIAEVQVGKNPTMHEALLDAQDAGYIVENINAKSKGNLLVWDQTLDRVALIEKETGKVIAGQVADINNKVSIWQTAESYTAGGYSIYLKNGYNGSADISGVNTGIDVGNNENISSISYVNSSSQSVVIRTNGGTLTVNAVSDTVKHYGDAQVVTLTAVGEHSYYEHGSVNLVDIKKGRFVIANDREAEVGTIYLTATGDGYDGIILATQSGSELPEVVARESVTLPTGSNKKLVVTIQQVDSNGTADSSKTEEIYLYPASDVKEADKGYNVSDLGLLVVEALSESGRAEAASELAGKGEDVIARVQQSNVTTIEEVVAAATEFAGGRGTETSPWLIIDYDTMQAISNHFNDGKQNYYKVKDGVEIIDCNDGNREWVPVSLYGHFDGNGVTFKNLNDVLFSNIYQNNDSGSSDVTAEIKNLTIEAYIVKSAYASGLVYSLGDKVNFSNIQISGYIEGSYASSFVAFGPWQYDNVSAVADWTFDNCNSTAMLCGTAGTAGFVNHSFCAVGSTAKLINSKFTGEMRLVKAINTTSKNDYHGGTDGHITAEINAYNAAYYYQNMGNIVFSETFTDGTNVNSLHYNKWTSKTAQGSAQSNVLCNRDRVTLAPLTSITQLNTNGVNTVSVAATNSSVTYAKAVLFIGPNDAENETGGYEGAWYTESIALNNGYLTTNEIKTFKIALNGQFYDWTDNTWKQPSEITNTNQTGIFGDYFNLAVSDFYGRTYAQKHIDIIQYNSLKQVVSKTSVNFAVSTNLSVYDYTGNKFAANGSVASVTAAKRAVFGTAYSLELQDDTLGTDDLVVKLGNVVLTAGTDYSVENGVLNINASAIQQSTYAERNITVFKKLTITLNGDLLDGSYQNQTKYTINVAGLTTSNKSNLVVRVNDVVISEGSGRYTVANGKVTLDAKIMTGDVVITFEI